MLKNRREEKALKQKAKRQRKKARIEKTKKDIALLESMMQVKDRIIVELLIVLTVAKIKIPSHLLEIIVQLYPEKMAILEKLEQKVSATNENEGKGKNESEADREKIVSSKRASLSLVKESTASDKKTADA